MDDYLHIEHVEGRHQEQRPQHVGERQQGVHLQPVQERQPELRFMRVEERGRVLHLQHVQYTLFWLTFSYVFNVYNVSL